MTLSHNRITSSITRTREMIEAATDVPLETRENLRSELDMTLEEYIRLHELKSLAQAQGELTLDEALTVYNLMGNTPMTFNAQPLAEKMVLTNLLRELLQRRIRRHQHAEAN